MGLHVASRDLLQDYKEKYRYRYGLSSPFPGRLSIWAQFNEHPDIAVLEMHSGYPSKIVFVTTDYTLVDTVFDALLDARDTFTLRYQTWFSLELRKVRDVKTVTLRWCPSNGVDDYCEMSRVLAKTLESLIADGGVK